MIGGISIQIDDAVAREMISTLKLPKHEVQTMHEHMVDRAGEITRQHLKQVAYSRHGTATRLGAEPTNFWASAVEGITTTATAEEGAIGLRHPGISRAVRPVTIRPTGGRKFLTLPKTRGAYGRSVRQFEAYFGRKLFRPLKKGSKATGSRAGADGRKRAIFPSTSRMRVLGFVFDGKFQTQYALVAQVTLAQDRSLLPSDAIYIAAGKHGILMWIADLKARQRALRKFTSAKGKGFDPGSIGK